MNNKTTTTSSRGGSFRSIFALGALAVGTLVVTPAPAQAAKITVSGYGHSVTVDCDCLSFPSGTSCESFCDDLDSGWNGISCSYNPMNGTVTITHGALAWIPEREFVTSSGDINFGASGGAPQAGEAKTASYELHEPKKLSYTYREKSLDTV